MRDFGRRGRTGQVHLLCYAAHIPLLDAYAILTDGQKFGPYAIPMRLDPDWQIRGTFHFVNTTGEKIILEKAVFVVPDIGVQVHRFKRKLRPRDSVQMNYTLSLNKDARKWLDCEMLEDAEVLSQLPIC